MTCLLPVIPLEWLIPCSSRPKMSSARLKAERKHCPSRQGSQRLGRQKKGQERVPNSACQSIAGEISISCQSALSRSQVAICSTWNLPRDFAAQFDDQRFGEGRIGSKPTARVCTILKRYKTHEHSLHGLS